ncbi:MAG: hypothetical protein PHH09_03975 [Methanoregulaceae archaeon]|nr:hypothetical protein [Methanoregulaceae archaeon]
MHDIHSAATDHGLGEDLLWPDSPVLDTLANEIEAQVTGVSRDQIPYYTNELKTILWDYFRPVRDMFPTIRVVRSKHVKDLVRKNPTLYPHLAALTDRQLTKVVSMLLRQQHPVLNNKNRGKFLVEEGVQ